MCYIFSLVTSVGVVIPMAGSSSSSSTSTVIIVLHFQSGYECWCGDSYGR